MHPDLSPHLHTEECNLTIRLLLQCHKDNPVSKFMGKCNQQDTELHRCLKKEYLEKLAANKLKTTERRQRMGLLEQS
ncbi:COX assembly mitochondrial protein 2 homolog [Asterias rubens]|uniref:COX assembly mitochondrial protein 2 homolog n=1 Tax=Asterias rubens TaxID=7604 RepID=UPI0014553F19|nr:COX assembly mitochondrial protein 2 homolog [Asterias rubens]